MPIKISLEELEQMASDPDVPESELRGYFSSSFGKPRPFAPALVPNPEAIVIQPEAVPLEGAMDFANSWCRRRRRRRFDRRIRRGDKRPVLVSEGDSWFQFPFLIDDVIDHLYEDYTVRSLGAAGDTAANIIRSAEYLATLREQAERVQAFLLSAAGNDVLGDIDGVPQIKRLLKPRSGTEPAHQLVNWAALKATLESLRGAYLQIITSIRALPGLETLPVVVHGYDYPFPGQKDDPRDPIWAAPDQWLGRPLNELNIRQPSIQRAVLKVLLDELYGMLGELTDADPHVHLVDLRGSLPRRSDWADEIHGTDKGFKGIAKRFRQVIESARTERRGTFSSAGLEADSETDEETEADRSLETTEINMPNSDNTNLSVQQTAVSMDPRLQRAVSYQRRGRLMAATASSAPSEIPVIAKVKSTSKWEGLSEVRGAMTIATEAPDDKTTIVTGRVPLRRIEHIRGLDFVVSLKAAQAMQPTLAAGVKETSARPDQLPAGSVANGGDGVVIGIVDYGCDYMHRNFLNGAGKTRLLSIWHQGGALDPAGDVPYGREYLETDIDAALAQSDPYKALGYAPSPDTVFYVGTHGTHVMDIAAGNGFGTGVAGFAPNADLIFVDASHRDIAFSGPGVVNTSFGDSVMLLEAVQYIFEKAGPRPCVVNISLGTNGGPHDGSTLVEEGIDRLVASAPNRAVTISASNSHDDGIHASGQVAQNGSTDMVWRIPANDFSHNELEIWYSAGDIFDVELISPSGNSLGTIPAGSNGELSDVGGTVQIFAANRIGDPNNGDNMIGVFFEQTVASGSWTVRLHGQSVTNGEFHAWIERDNARPSSFAPPHDNSHTIGSISCGRNSIVVGSYDAHKKQKPISFFSSQGPTRDGRQKPEISAPGHAVYAAHSRTETEVVTKSGTSMASPAVAGIVALMFAEARGLSIDLSVSEVRDILVGAHRSRPPQPGQWDPRFGFGRINASAAIAAVQAKAGTPSAVGAAARKKERHSKRA